MDDLKTKATLPAYYMEFERDADDPLSDTQTIAEITDVRGDEIEIAFSVDGNRCYLDFRMGDLRRALKEFNK